MSLVDHAVSALVQVLALGGVPFLGFWVFHRWRHQRSFEEVSRRAGMQLGRPRYMLLSLGLAVGGAVALLLWSPPLEPFTREGSAQSRMVGLGLGFESVTTAVLHGVVQTGFTEELLFRGLIAGSLARRLSVAWANVTQASIFLLPHLLLLLVMPEMWTILPLVFVAGLILGWIRIRSGSILGPWILHASGNVTMALMVAAGTSP